MKYMCLIMGIKNATTGYHFAAVPFLPYMFKHAANNTYRVIPTSIRIGTRRLEVYVDDRTIKLIDSRALKKALEESDARATLCALNKIDTCLF